LLKAAQVDDLLDEGDDIKRCRSSKPAPDIVEAALNKLKMEPSEVLMIGDTPYDIESAKGAGVDTIGVRSGGFDDEQLKGAIAIYNDPADLLAHYSSSPLREMQ
jgi:phosphoglycolate phosphatase-like HAD superfamily hydrolase